MKGENVFGLRKSVGLTQEQLADKLGVERTTVAKWETGEASPRADKLPKLAEVLGCRIDDLFEKKENPA